MQIWMRLLFLHDFLSLSFLYPFLQVQWYLSPFPLTQSCWQPPLSLRSHGCTKQEEKKKKMLKSINILVRRSNNRPFVVEYYNWSVLFIGLYSYKTARQSHPPKKSSRIRFRIFTYIWYKSSYPCSICIPSCRRKSLQISLAHICLGIRDFSWVCME